jgi:hypothetical protein
MQDTMTRTEELHSIFWDMYKDAHGFRPRHVDTTGWTEAEFNQEFEQLSRMIQHNECERKISEENAAHEFEMRVQSIIACGAEDRDMAMRWIHESEQTRGDNDYLAYTLGLPYRYFK